MVRVNPLGVLVSDGLPWRLRCGVVMGGDMTRLLTVLQ